MIGTSPKEGDALRRGTVVTNPARSILSSWGMLNEIWQGCLTYKIPLIRGQIALVARDLRRAARLLIYGKGAGGLGLGCSVPR